MVYVDQNGLVAIDEIEAEEDVAKLKKTLALMNESLEILKNIENLNSTAKGDTNITVDTAASILIRQINNQITEINHLIKSINDVVEKYKIIDTNMKNQVNTSIN